MASLIVESIRSEIDKTRTLPATSWTVLGTVLVAMAIGGALGIHSAASAAPYSVAEVVAQTVPFIQAGFIVLGATPIAHEYGGRQIRTSLVVVPNRGRLIAGKTVAIVVLSTGVAVLTVAVIVIASAVTLASGSVVVPRFSFATIVGAVIYLALVALFGHAVTLLVRHQMPTLIGLLGYVYLVLPILAGQAEVARWLPVSAGVMLFEPNEAMHAGTIGAVAFGGWILLIGAIGAASLIRRDP